MRRSFLMLTLCAAPLMAQAPAANANPAVAAARAQWTQVHTMIQRSAEQLPESLYNFKPTPVVRTFGELFGHVAGSEMMFCAAVRGDAPKAEDAVESSAKTKAALVQALKDAAAYCGPAYNITDAEGAKMVDVFGARSKINTLVFNAVHDGEHYGNIITMLRLKGLVPPSSQR